MHPDDSNSGGSNNTAPSSHGNRPLPERMEELRHEAEALNLRSVGYTYRRIAEAQQVNVSTAHRRVTRALDRLVPVDKVEQVRRIEAEGLEAAKVRVMEKLAVVDDPDVLGRLVGSLVKLSDRYSRLLGLDVPVTQHLKVSAEDDLDREIAELMEELVAGGEGPPAGDPAGEGAGPPVEEDSPA